MTGQRTRGFLLLFQRTLSLLALVRDTLVEPHLSLCFNFNFKPTRSVAFLREYIPFMQYPWKLFPGLSLKKKKLFSPFKTVIFNRNFLLHNSRASSFHNKWLLLGLFLMLHLRCVLVGRSFEIQGLDHSTWTARPGYAHPCPVMPVPLSTPDCVAATSRHGCSTPSSSMLFYLQVKPGDTTGSCSRWAAWYHQHLRPWWNFNFI